MSSPTSTSSTASKAQELLIEATNDFMSSRYDAVVVVTDSPTTKLTGKFSVLLHALQKRKEIDDNAYTDLNLYYVDEIPSHRFIYAPTGPLTREIDDPRRISEAAGKGIHRAVRAGSKSPLLIELIERRFANSSLVALLGALHVLYVPLEVREFSEARKSKVNKLGLWGAHSEPMKKVITLASALESGRSIARDIGGSDPERMAAPKVATYVQSLFEGSAIEVTVIQNDKVIEKDFPLLSAVNRATKHIDRHRARVILLSYIGEGEIDTTLMLVGKGVTYDTGGADIKAGGIMAGMHRDKCGAAAVCGFFQVLNLLKPKGIKVVGAMAMVRNSVSGESYVSDEIITARTGVRVRIGNTDAEGRLAMADLLYVMKEKAKDEKNPHIYTIATLTGHAVLAVGEGYSIAIDNGPAAAEDSARHLQVAGESIADPVEISTLRREDFDLVAPKSEYEDLLQCNNLPSSRTPRGHQFPAAFMIQVSGLDKHGKNSDKPIKYSHLDIAASSGPFPGVPTGSPILALSARYILKKFI